MNELLKMLNERLVQIAIVGLKSAPEDFRLKKIQEKLKILSTKAPVLGKLYELVTKLAEGEELVTTFAQLTNLVNAMLYTQGSSEISGEKESIEVFELSKQHSKLSHLQLKEVREILNGNKTSKWYNLKKAYDQGELFDYRLLDDFLENLNDTYKYEYDYDSYEGKYFGIVTILSQYGEAILPTLLKRFDGAYNGEKRNIVRLVSELGKEKYNDYYIKWIENETDDKVVISSLKALAYEEANVHYLLEYKTRKKKFQEARVYALAHFDEEEARAEVRKQCYKSDEIFRMVVENQLISDDKIYELALEQAELLNKAENLDKQFIDDNKNYLNLCFLLWNMNRDNEKAKSVFLQIMKMDTGDPELCFESKAGIREVSLTILNRYKSQEMLEYLASLKDSYQGYYITTSFLAALYCYDSKKVYDEFSELVFNKYKKVNVNILAFLLQLAGSVTDMKFSEACVSCEKKLTCDSSSFKSQNDIVRIQLSNEDEVWFDLSKIEWDPRWILLAKQKKQIALFNFFAIQNDLDNGTKKELRQECMESLENLKQDTGNDNRYPNIGVQKRKKVELTMKSIVLGLFLSDASDIVINHIIYFTFYLGSLEQLFFTYLEKKDLVQLEKVRAQVQDLEVFGNKKINKFIDKTIHIVEAKDKPGKEIVCQNR